MATGFTERQSVQDPNANQGGNAPTQRLAVQGIMGTRGAPANDTSQFSQALANFGRIGKAQKRKKDNADFIEGKMASMAGKTQAEVAAEGNQTTMAGFVSLEVGNAVAEWKNDMLTAASSEHFGTDPEQYRKLMAKSSADLISKMGGDDFAEEQLTAALAPALAQVGASQAAVHAQYTETETVNAYTTSLLMSGQNAASEYDGAAVEGTAGAGATTSRGDYQAVAQSFTDQIISVESGGNARAKNPNSSATGLGQFIGSTWIAMLKKYRPDLAAGKGTQELLALRYNGALSKQMTTAYASENLAALGAAGLPTTSGTAYLAHFAGLGGAKRVLRGNPNSPVSTTMTPSQIKANQSIMYKNGRMITNGELRAWADRKMGNAKGAPASSAAVRNSIMTNPGLPPAKHRAAVVSAITSSLAAGDGSLYQNAGGLEGLMELNLSASDISRIRNSHEAFNNERQNAYNMDYERAQHDLLEEAGTGEFTEEQMFDKLSELQNSYERSDAEKHRLHTAMQNTMTKREVTVAKAEEKAAKDADKAAKDAAKDVWDDPERQFDLIDLKNDVLDGTLKPRAAMQEAIEIGKMYGADPEATEEAVKEIMAAYNTVRTNERKKVADVTKAAMKKRETDQAAANLVSNSILGTGTKEEQQAGIALLEKTLVEDLRNAQVPANELPSRANDAMAKVLVQNDVVDKRRASVMRAALANPFDKDGNPTEGAVQALAFYLDLKHGANAAPEYMTRMFKGQEKTLEMLVTAEEHMIGDAGMDQALITAHKQITDPVTAARIASNQKLLKGAEYQNAIKEEVIAQSGLADTRWNNVMNTFNPNWHTERLDEEGIDRIMSDTGMNLVIEGETRSAMALYPNATPTTISKLVAGQMAERGSVMGSSFVMAPVDTTVPKVMGLNSTDPNAANSAITQYVAERGEELFSADVWADIGPSIMGSAKNIVGGMILKGTGPASSMREGGNLRPEFVVELIGDNLVITPASEKYRSEDGLFGDSFSSLPEAQSVIIRAKDVGTWYNEQQTSDAGFFGELKNSAIDIFRDMTKDAEAILNN